MVATTSQAYSTISYGLDPAGRVLTTSYLDSDDDQITTTNDYASSSDSPAWTSNTNSGITRYTPGLDGLTDAQTSDGTSMLYLNDPRGSIVAQLPYTATSLIPPGRGITSYGGYTDFGLNDIRCYTTSSGPTACNASVSGPYGYLGGHERATTPSGGLILMGQRLYNPTTGRFLQPDPVPGGSANTYDYTSQDPLNNTDLTGTFEAFGGQYLFCSSQGVCQTQLQIDEQDSAYALAEVTTFVVGQCLFWSASYCGLVHYYVPNFTGNFTQLEDDVTGYNAIDYVQPPSGGGLIGANGVAKLAPQISIWACIGSAIATIASIVGLIGFSLSTAGTADVFYAGALIVGAGTAGEQFTFFGIVGAVIGSISADAGAC
jgi:RHS repeat-associated protein